MGSELREHVESLIASGELAELAPDDVADLVRRAAADGDEDLVLLIEAAALEETPKP